MSSLNGFHPNPGCSYPRYGDLHRCLNSSWDLYKKERKSSAVVQENSQQKQIILDFHVLTIYPFWMGYLYIHIYYISFPDMEILMCGLKLPRSPENVSSIQKRHPVVCKNQRRQAHRSGSGTMKSDQNSPI